MATMADQNKEWEKNYWHNRLRAVSGNDSEWKKIYAQYLNTDIWKEIKRGAIKRAGYRCERCNSLFVGETKLQVHHKNYDRVGGFEMDSDLQVVCAGECHQKADIKRKRVVAQRRISARYQARFNAWGEAHYRNDWDRKKYDDESGAEEEFHQYVYKEWCNDNDVGFDPLADVPELFVDLLREGREDEYDEFYG